jgi:3-oxoacyl-[acyl-carrier protein] reductase
VSTQKKRHIVISGGSRGLGQAIVEDLLAAGYQVSTFARKPTDFTESRSADPNFLFFTADVTDHASVAEFLQTAEK